ncbi:MAG: addiction module protein [Deltaproteobacteria bacterium]|nr:addiction module protein [Deltaproteobacteria bacterium]
MEEGMGQPSIPEPPGFSELTKEEQISYLEALWDRIAEQPGELPVPESHLTLAAERLAAYRRDPGRAKSALEVVDHLAKRSK